MVNYLGSSNVTTFTANVGDTVKIYRPIGYPPYPHDSEPEEPVKSDYECLGFVVMDENLGKFINYNNLSYSDGYVFYKHEKSGKQTIKYTSHAIMDIIFYITVQGIVVHDHASVPQGGPAYATYYTELADNREQEGG